MTDPTGRAEAEKDLDALAVQVEGLNLEENRLGSGACGIVHEVTVDRKKCITKKLHNGFIGEYFISKTIPIATGVDFMYKRSL